MGNFWSITRGFWSFKSHISNILVLSKLREVRIGQFRSFFSEILAFFGDFRLFWVIFGRSKEDFGGLRVISVTFLSFVSDAR